MAPRFASDEEALAAAEEAYAAYIAMVDTIMGDGGKDPERLMPLASQELYEREAEGFANVAAKGIHATGKRTFVMSLQRFSDSEIVAYVCDDISQVDLIDSEGNSTVLPGRLSTYEFEVTVALADRHSVVQSKTLWKGDSTC